MDEKLTFNDHITSKLTTVNKLISTLRKLYHYMPRDSLVTIYKSFIIPHLDYADVIFDKPNNFSDSFLSQTIREWNKLDTSICQAPSYSVFRKALLDFIRPTANSTFGTNDVSGLKL